MITELGGDDSDKMKLYLFPSNGKEGYLTPQFNGRTGQISIQQGYMLILFLDIYELIDIFPMVSLTLKEVCQLVQLV